MLISDSHQFIFLRMRKVASTSMQEILRPLCIPLPQGKLAHLKSRAGLERNYHKYLFRAHDDIQAAKRRMPAKSFANYFKFAFVRNPWDRLVSEYEFLLSRPKHGRHARVKKLSGFSDFIRMQMPRTDAHQNNMLSDANGNILMDFVGKMENIDQDWQLVCEKIGIACESLPRRKVIARRAYKDYFNDKDIEFVTKHWQRDIQLFNYSYHGQS